MQRRKIRISFLIMQILFYIFLVLSEEDPALQLLTLKSHLKNDINRLINYYQRHNQGLYIKKF